MSEDVREWGPEIPVDGVRPEWLEGDPKKVWASDRQGRWLDRSINAAFDNWSWGWIGTIRLPVDHSHYAAQEPRRAPSGGEVGPEVVERLRASHAALLDRIERNQCEHENTHRGGAIWTICEDCGEKWADDRGGFQPYVTPDWLVEAREVASALLPEPVDADLKMMREDAEAAGWHGSRLEQFEAGLLDLWKRARGRSLEKGDR